MGVDPNGKLHLIECKGNQQGHGALLEQLADGRGQKQNVTFPDESRFVDQRLVVGVAIAAAKSRWNTALRVEDPPPPEPAEEHYVVTANNPEMLSRELDIGALARILVLSGEGRLLARILPDELDESKAALNLLISATRPERSSMLASANGSGELTECGFRLPSGSANESSVGFRYDTAWTLICLSDSPASVPRIGRR